MTVKQYFGRNYVIESYTLYAMVDHNGRSTEISREVAARITKDPEFPAGWRVTREIIQTEVLGCPWCGVRPLVFEPDCDGMASTGSCGSEQCGRLRRCEGCGEDGAARFVSVRGHLCGDCDDFAYKANRVAARDRYALISYAEYYGETA